VPSPMYMRLPPFVDAWFFPASLTHKPPAQGSKWEETGLDPRLEVMSPRFFLRLTFAALVLVALVSALAQLAVGRRPALLGA
jgi:hypothetical protein